HHSNIHTWVSTYYSIGALSVNEKEQPYLAALPLFFQRCRQVQHIADPLDDRFHFMGIAFQIIVSNIDAQHRTSVEGIDPLNVALMQFLPIGKRRLLLHLSSPLLDPCKY